MFLLLVISSQQSNFNVISKPDLPNYYITNTENKISLKENLNLKFRKNDAHIVQLEEVDGLFKIKVGQSYLYKDMASYSLIGKDFELEDQGFMFEIAPGGSLGDNIIVSGMCISLGEYNGPLDGYNITVMKCVKLIDQDFIIEVADLEIESTTLDLETGDVNKKKLQKQD